MGSEIERGLGYCLVAEDAEDAERSIRGESWAEVELRHWGSAAPPFLTLDYGYVNTTKLQSQLLLGSIF